MLIRKERGVMVRDFNSRTRDEVKQISVSSRLAWSAKLVPGHPGIHKKKKNKQKKNKKRKPGKTLGEVGV